METRGIEGAIRIIIYGNPVTKKNSQRILKNKKTGRNFIAPSEKYVQYEKDAWPFIVKARASGRMIDSPVNVKCIFYMNSHRRCDLVNLLEAVDDILVHYHVVKDDCADIIAAHDGSRVRYDKDEPRVEITIDEVKWND